MRDWRFFPSKKTKAVQEPAENNDNQAPVENIASNPNDHHPESPSGCLSLSFLRAMLPYVCKGITTVEKTVIKVAAPPELQETAIDLVDTINEGAEDAILAVTGLIMNESLEQPVNPNHERISNAANQVRDVTNIFIEFSSTMLTQIAAIQAERYHVTSLTAPAASAIIQMSDVSKRITSSFINFATDGAIYLTDHYQDIKNNVESTFSLQKIDIKDVAITFKGIDVIVDIAKLNNNHQLKNIFNLAQDSSLLICNAKVSQTACYLPTLINTGSIWTGNSSYMESLGVVAKSILGLNPVFGTYGLIANSGISVVNELYQGRYLEALLHGGIMAVTINAPVAGLALSSAEYTVRNIYEYYQDLQLLGEQAKIEL